jgi:glutathione S-transferase
VPELEIIGSARSTYTRAVCMVCEEKGIAYTLVETLLGSPELRAIHPFAKMPVLRHGDFELCESAAIARYLDRSFPGPALFPSEPRRAAQVDQWVSLVNTAVDPAWIRGFLVARIRGAAAAAEAALPAVRAQIGVLDRAVAKTGHLAGDSLTFADLNLLPIVALGRLLPETAEALGAAPALSAWFERHSARPSFQRTIPPLGPPGRYRPS